jgi:putative tryptophan/tyrosine transport system substrate-binding protein
MLSPLADRQSMNFDHLKRRDFITLLGSTAAWPFAARAQQPGRIYRLSILTGLKRDTPQMITFFEELGRLGFVEGQNLSVVPGGFEVRHDQLSERAKEIIKAAPDVIFTPGPTYTRAAQIATRTVPIVGGSGDMLADGLVSSLSRPEGNTTGMSLITPELDGKRQDILIEAVPGADRIAALADPNIRLTNIRALQDAAQAHGVVLSVFSAAMPEQIEPAINDAKRSGVGALNVLATPLFSENRRIIFERAVALRLPAIYEWAEMAEEGGLIAYGARNTEIFRRRARMIVKVLRGTKPADIPIEQPSSFELVINLKVAKAIGHEIPAGLVLRADRVIE